MRIVIGVLALSAAAACGDDGNMFPVGGGGNDGGFTLPDGGGTADSPGDGGGSGSGNDATVLPVDAPLFDGRVCLLTDARRLNVCAATGAGNLTVRVGAASAVTEDDGSFQIEAQTGAQVWRVTGANVVSSYEVLADYFIPAMPKATYDTLLSTNGVTLVPGEGAMMVFVSNNAMGVAGATAVTTPPAFYDPFYDDATEADWNQTATMSNGAVWIPGIDVGTATVDVSTSLGDVSVTGPIFDGGITFANALIP